MRYATFALVALALVLPGRLGSQTANVIELTPADAARAQKVWDALQKAQIEWKTVENDIDGRYVHKGEVLGAYGSTTGGGLIKQAIHGFENGFEFSKDFRYIVPKPPEPPTTPKLQFYSNPVLNVPTPLYDGWPVMQGPGLQSWPTRGVE